MCRPRGCNGRGSRRQVRGMTTPLPGQRTKVAVVSPQAMVAAGITAVLGRHPARFELVQSGPEVVLYDVLGLADGDGAELDRLVNETAAVVLAIGRDLQPDLLNQALAQGADGCFS